LEFWAQSFFKKTKKSPLNNKEFSRKLLEGQHGDPNCHIERWLIRGNTYNAEILKLPAIISRPALQNLREAESGAFL